MSQPQAIDDSIPVEDDEARFRLVHQVYFNPTLPLPVQPEAFRPTNRDTNGISLFRERFVRAEEVVQQIDIEKRSMYRVARLLVVDFKRLHLTVVPDPIVTLAGHAVIPELNSVSYQRDKLHCKVIQKQLAELASRGIVSIEP